MSGRRRPSGEPRGAAARLARALSLALAAIGTSAPLSGGALAQVAPPELELETAPQTFDDLGAPEEMFAEADWRALAEGKTLTYVTPFGLMGREYYVPNSDRVVFVYYDGRCYNGTWAMAGGIYCFEYDGQHCFEHLRRGDRIIARELDGDEQVVTEITDEVLSCEPELMSEADPPIRVRLAALLR